MKNYSNNNNKRDYKKSNGLGKKPRKFDREQESNNNKSKYKKNTSPGKKPRKFDREQESFNKNREYKKNTTPGKRPYKFDKEPELMRLNKYIANSGVCSRREADELIKNGFVAVNGEVVTEMGLKIKPTDTVTYKGEKLKGEKTVYMVMNKPKNYITSNRDPEGRQIVTDLFRDEIKERIFPVGRLDRNTTGVLLFTNDGDLAQTLTHPSSEVPKIYAATLDKDCTKQDMTKLVEGFELDDGPVFADTAYYFNDARKDKVFLEIHSGKNRIVRRMFEHLGYNVKNLDRIEFAGITKKDLKRGQWRFLSDKEIGFLKMTAGKVKK